MEDFTFYFSYFDELEKFDYDTEKFIFNGYPIGTYNDYRTHLIEQLKGFEKKLDAIIMSDYYPTDKLIRNFGVMNIKFNKIYEQVKKDYSRFLTKYKYWTLPKSKEHEARKIHSGKFTKSPELKKLDVFIGFHVSILNQTRDCINSRLTFVATADTGKKIVIPTESPSDNPETPITSLVTSATLVHNNSNKLLLNLGKRDIALLFLLFYMAEIIRPKSKKELYDFIENNFKYIDNSKGKHKISDIKTINQPFARLTEDIKGTESNTKFRKKIIEAYRDKIYDCFDTLLKIEMPDFRNKY